MLGGVTILFRVKRIHERINNSQATLSRSSEHLINQLNIQLS